MGGVISEQVSCKDRTKIFSTQGFKGRVVGLGKKASHHNQYSFSPSFLCGAFW